MSLPMIKVGMSIEMADYVSSKLDEGFQILMNFWPAFSYQL